MKGKTRRFLSIILLLTLLINGYTSSILTAKDTAGIQISWKSIFDDKTIEEGAVEVQVSEDDDTIAFKIDIKDIFGNESYFIVDDRQGITYEDLEILKELNADKKYYLSLKNILEESNSEGVALEFDKNDPVSELIFEIDSQEVIDDMVNIYITGKTGYEKSSININQRYRTEDQVINGLDKFPEFDGDKRTGLIEFVQSYYAQNEYSGPMSI